MEAQATHSIIHSPLPDSKPLYTEDTLTICIMGDIMMHTPQIENAHRGRNRYDFSSYFKHIRKHIEDADIAIANMEFTLAGEPYTGYPSFSAPDSFAEHIASCGFDVLLTANNHIFDKGSKGAERTLNIYKELSSKYGLSICGLYADHDDIVNSFPLFIRKNNFRIALLNCTYGTNLGADLHWPKVIYMNERKRITEALTKAEEADFTLVMPHWGTEYDLVNSEDQKAYAEWLGERGADMIIGTHPHVPQNHEILNITAFDKKNINLQVVYSIGNLISNMSAPNTQLGLMAIVRLVRERSGKINTLPVSFKYLWCSRPGGFNSSYTVIPLKEYIGRREMWHGGWDYDKMVSTYNRVKAIIGIEEN